MAIKKINREELNKKVAAAKPVPVVEEVVETPVVEEVQEEVMEEVQEEVMEEVQEEAVEEVATPVVTKPVSKIQTQVNKVNSNIKGEKKMNNVKTSTPSTTAKKTLGNRAPKKETVERTIGTVYPKDLLLKNIQAALDAQFEGITLADTKVIFDVVEESLLSACQVASVRFLGGVVKAQERNALVAKAPKVDYASYTAPRSVITITGAEIGQPEKYRGRQEGDKFIVTEALNYEDNKWYAAEGTIDL